MKFSSVVTILAGLPALVQSKDHDADVATLRKKKLTQFLTSSSALDESQIVGSSTRTLRKKGGRKGKKKCGRTYLALGDSLATGTQAPVLFTDTGYTDELFEYLEKEYKYKTLVKMGCPGDDSNEFLGLSGASLCYGDGSQPFPLGGGAPSQLDSADEYLTTNPGEVGLITLSIGANDLLACDLFGEQDMAVLQQCLAVTIGELVDNVLTIVGTLRSIAPDVPIVAMNIYQPYVALWLNGPTGRAFVDLSLGVTAALNNALEQAYGALQVPVVDAAAELGSFLYEDEGTGPEPPTNVKLVCQWTNMCEMQEGSGDYVLLGDFDPATELERPDIHPNNEGYAVLADAHIAIIEALSLVTKASASSSESVSSPDN